MKGRSFRFGLFVGFIIFVAGAFCVSRIYSHPTALAQKIAEADSVTATNQNEAVSIVVMKGDAKKIVQAIATASRGPLFLKAAATPFLRLEFRKGTNYLATVYSCGKLFWAGQTEYYDQTGALEALMNEYLHQMHQRWADEPHELPTPTNNATAFTNSP